MFNEKPYIKEIALDGNLKDRNIRAKGRLRFSLICLFFSFFLIALKVTYLSALYTKSISSENKNYVKKSINNNQRADIVDRNGVLLATSLPWDDLGAHPKKINNKDKLILSQSMSEILTGASQKEIYNKLTSNKNFVYLKRKISPREYNAIVKLKEPEIFKLKNYARHYPHKEHAAHILGGVNIDNVGIKGIEKKYNEILQDQNFIDQDKQLQLSIDIRVQKILDYHLSQTINKHTALGGTGIVLDIKKSEILAMTSLPQYNPNEIRKITKDNEFNMATLGVYELGSVFKSLTLAMALDKNVVTEDTSYDATKPLQVGKYTIHDYKPQKRHLKISECVLYSSNICFAQVGRDLGEDNIKEYIKKMKLNYKAEIEIPESGEPLLPTIWRDTNVMTFSYGHGVAVSPLQFVNAFSSVINGGNFRYSTLLKGKYLDYNSIDKVISKETSYRLRKLLREVVKDKKGSGDKAEVPGYSVAGKTGTAIKNESNRYKTNKNITSFVGFFPSYEPEFLVFIMVDDPQPIKETFNYVTGGWVAAPTVKKIISDMAPKLGIQPENQLNENLKKHANLNN